MKRTLPTALSWLTGRNPPAVGVDHIGEYANGADKSQGGSRLDAGTIADCLHAAGEGTFAVGKWHLAPMSELGADSLSAGRSTGSRSTATKPNPEPPRP